MKKIIITLIVLFTINSISVKADEGMWLVHLIGEKTYADMTKRGLKLTKEQLYSMNSNSLKDAIVLFGGGCTAEVVSKEGLLFTNHHCGYSNIAASSTVDHNYLKDGFWAKSKQEEIACPGLSVQFLVKIEDVTEAVLTKIKDVKPEDITTQLTTVLNEMSGKTSDGTGYETRVSSFFKGNQFLKFTYQRYTDVRLVGAPPESIGKFGGDTDNWEWPRHTGDFSIFRVYMAADGKPSDFKAENVPYKPKQFLQVSIKGVNDGDYAMIYGYPGGTNRYETSHGVKLKIDIENPNLVTLRDARLKAMMTEMVKDPAVKIQLASSYAGIANYWKFFDGETKQLIKHNVLAQKEKEEKQFETWAKGKSEYDNLFSGIKASYDSWRPYAKGRVYLNEGIMGSPLLAASSSLKALDDALSAKEIKPEAVTKATAAVKASFERFNKDENTASDKSILATVLNMYYHDVDANQQPIEFYTKLKTSYGDLEKDETYKKFAKDVFEKSILLNAARFTAFVENPDTAILHKDLAYSTALAFINNYNNNYSKFYKNFISTNYAYGNKYLKGVLEMKKGQALYPDANQTMRVSFGNVKSYSPRDAVNYKEICTLSGVMEKYTPGDYEFDAPAKLIELIAAKDFGQYVDKKTNDIVVTFITTNDITGGNSGSPVLNAKGELIGLAFDGNYEALSHKIAFDGELNRTICLDVRYLLFVVDKLGGAKNIVDELILAK
ncbi:S46 family peptidase [Aurantibacillus circumpalustris]|uniref:S46 family peptidase n=1 Tax=Aurantibacillus circumpalustris TaxID=3036359 RepID=UPI00295ABAE4|nr:S46 family peptidase [Aurantibacillus circumpalustris]